MANMIRLAGRRVLTLVPLVLGITLLVFLVLQFTPNDPAYNALGEAASPEAREAFAEARGLNDPIPVQYVRFLGNLLQGDLGVTAPPARPVTSIIGNAFPLTFQLTMLGLSISVVLALVFGTLAALFRDRWPDQMIRAISIAGVATPSFWLGILLIQQFSLELRWFPSGGYIAPSDSLSGWLRTMVLPAIALAVPVAASLTRIVRTSVVEELDKDYVRTAYGNGLPPVVVVGRNVLRNALMTPLTVLGLRVGFLLAGAVVIETIFGLPGMGMVILNGVTSSDLAVVQGAVLVIALVFVVINLGVDLLYMLINPRIREL
jgi:peptide/nickel transport system permease protein